MLKSNPHTPNHLFLDQAIYFVSGAIYQKRHLLAQDGHKAVLLEYIREYCDKFEWELFHWVILDNHYHLILRSQEGKDLTRLFKAIHSRSAIDIHREIRREKPVWWNYWDYCPRNEKDTMIRINYLLYNPVKHGYAKKLQDYPYSSFHHRVEKVGRAALVEQFRTYPEYKTLVLHEAHKDDF
jgi:putative transposase